MIKTLIDKGIITEEQAANITFADFLFLNKNKT